MKTKHDAQLFDVKKYHRDVLRWYEVHGRKTLPWRTTRDAYHIYLSEVMLQQTQVKTVLERFYFPFLETFPTIEALAKAPREKVLKAWEGLGYYRRAGFVHEAAKAVVAQHGGQLPRDVEALIALPGIGRNTAHALACFAYGASVPVVEANVKRVLARLLGWVEMPKEKNMWEAAQNLTPKNAEHSFNYNQAMMDIGASICTPKAPDCKACPLESHCAGKGAPENYPTAKLKLKKAALPVREQVVLVLEWHGHVAMQPRESALLGGLWQFVELEAGTKSWQGMRFKKTQMKGEIRQIYSHFERRAQLVHVVLPQKINLPTPLQWINADERQNLPFSGFEKKVFAAFL